MKKTKKHRAYTDWIVNLAHELSLKYPKYSLAHSIKGEKKRSKVSCSLSDITGDYV